MTQSEFAILQICSESVGLVTLPKKLTCLLGARGDVTYLCNMYLDMYRYVYFLISILILSIFVCDALPRNVVGYFPTCRVNLNGRTGGHYAQTGRWLAQQRRSTCTLTLRRLERSRLASLATLKGLGYHHIFPVVRISFSKKHKKSHSWCLFSEML